MKNAMITIFMVLAIMLGFVLIGSVMIGSHEHSQYAVSGVIQDNTNGNLFLTFLLSCLCIFATSQVIRFRHFD